VREVLDRQQSAIIGTLKSNVYLDPQVLLREQQDIFATTWQYAGHIEKLMQAGAFRTCGDSNPAVVARRHERRI